MGSQDIADGNDVYFSGLQNMWDRIWEFPGGLDKCSSESDLVILGMHYKVNDENQEDEKSEEQSGISKCAGRATYEKIENSENSEDQLINVNYDKISDDKNTGDEPEKFDNNAIDNIKMFMKKISDTTYQKFHSELNYTYPQNALDDLQTRLWFTYRYGFPLIKYDENGSPPIHLGAILRGNMDIQNFGKGFTSDSGWGCMIRTSQTLLANALVSLKLGRNWRLQGSAPEDMKVHWEIVEQFADSPDARFSIHNMVLYAAKYCGRRPGEWFGPSNAARSIEMLCNESQVDTNLKVYISSDSGDIYEEDLLSSCYEKNIDKFTPVLILCGVRLGVHNINKIYWEFLKLTLDLPYSVGIAGGRPSSSHYFLGCQADYLLYLDPHIPQQAILLNDLKKAGSSDYKSKMLGTLHTTKIKLLSLGKVDPSMLIGFLVKTREEYNDLRQKINLFPSNRRFLNFSNSKPVIRRTSSVEDDIDGFVDLTMESGDEFLEHGEIIDDIDNKIKDMAEDKHQELAEYEKLEHAEIKDEPIVEIEKIDTPVKLQSERSGKYNNEIFASDGIIEVEDINNESIVFVSECGKILTDTSSVR